MSRESQINSLASDVVTNVVKKWINVEKQYSIDDDELKRVFQPKNLTTVTQKWYERSSQKMKIATGIFGCFRDTFSKEEIAILNINIYFNVESEFVFFASRSWELDHQIDKELENAKDHKVSNESLVQRLYGMVEEYCLSKAEKDQSYFTIFTGKCEYKNLAARFMFKLVQSIIHNQLWRNDPNQKINLLKKFMQLLDKFKMIKELSEPGEDIAFLIGDFERCIQIEIQELSKIETNRIDDWLRDASENLENITGNMLPLIHSCVQTTDRLPSDLNVRIRLLGEQWKKSFYNGLYDQVVIPDERTKELINRIGEIKKSSTRTIEQAGFMEDFQNLETKNLTYYSPNQLLRELFFDYDKITMSNDKRKKHEILPQWVWSLYNFAPTKKLSKEDEPTRKEFLYRIFKSHVLNPDLLIKILEECIMDKSSKNVDRISYLTEILHKSVSEPFFKEEKNRKEIFPIFELTSDPDFAKKCSCSREQLEFAAQNYYDALCRLQMITTRLSMLRWSISILYKQGSLIGQLGIIANARQLINEVAQLMLKYLKVFSRELEAIDQSQFSVYITVAINNKKIDDLTNWSIKLKPTRFNIIENIKLSVKDCNELIKKLADYISEEKALQLTNQIENQSDLVVTILRTMEGDLNDQFTKIDNYRNKNKEYLDFFMNSLKRICSHEIVMPSKSEEVKVTEMKSIPKRLEASLKDSQEILSQSQEPFRRQYMDSLLKLTPAPRENRIVHQTNLLPKSYFFTLRNMRRNRIAQIIAPCLKEFSLDKEYDPSTFVKKEEVQTFLRLKDEKGYSSQWKLDLRALFLVSNEKIYDESIKKSDLQYTYRVVKFYQLIALLGLQLHTRDKIEKLRKILTSEINHLEKLTKCLRNSTIVKSLKSSCEFLLELDTDLERQLKKFDEIEISADIKTEPSSARIEECNSYLIYIDKNNNPLPMTALSLKGKESLTEQLTILTQHRYQLFKKHSRSQNGQIEKEIERLDQLIAQLKDKELKAARESKQSTSISTYEEVEVPGDGNCLYSAVGIYVGKDPQQLREEVANELKLENYKLFLKLSSQQTSEQYIEGVRNGSEWGGNAEVTALMHILQRPIIVVYPSENPQVRAQNPTEGEKLYFDKGVPILVRYNGINHYNALILIAQNNPHASSNTLEAKLTQLIKDEKLSHSNAYIFIQSERDFSCVYVKNGILQQPVEKIMLQPSSQFEQLESLISQLDKRLDKNGYLLLNSEATQIIISNTNHTRIKLTERESILNGQPRAPIRSAESEQVKLLIQAAHQGRAAACKELGLRYLKGQGVEKDDKQAARWLEEAAKKGKVDANTAFQLGEYYRIYFEQDQGKAFYWYDISAQLGHMQAQYCLVDYYYRQGYGKELNIEVISKPYGHGNETKIIFHSSTENKETAPSPSGRIKGLFVIELTPQKTGYILKNKKEFELYSLLYSQFNQFCKFLNDAAVGNIIVLAVINYIHFSNALIHFLESKGASDFHIMKLTHQADRGAGVFSSFNCLGYGLIYKVLPDKKGEKLAENLGNPVARVKYSPDIYRALFMMTISTRVSAASQSSMRITSGEAQIEQKCENYPEIDGPQTERDSENDKSQDDSSMSVIFNQSMSYDYLSESTELKTPTIRRDSNLNSHGSNGTSPSSASNSRSGSYSSSTSSMSTSLSHTLIGQSRRASIDQRTTNEKFNFS